MGVKNYSGIIIADKQGQVVFRSGLGKDKTIEEQLLKKLWKDASDEKTCSSLQVQGERYFVMGRYAEEHNIFFIDPEGLNQGFFEFICSVDFGYDLLNEFFNNPYSDIVVVDKEGKILYMGRVHEKFFGLPPGGSVGKHCTEVIENSGLPQVLKSGKAEVGQLHEMHGLTRIVSRFPIIKNGEVVGAFGRVMFKGPEKLHELSQKIVKLKSEVEYYKREARSLREHNYGLNEIVGSSEAIQQLKADLIKVAALDAPVLLLGESGTGKELAAQAVHQLSARRDQSMVIVNSGALPSSLVESELFGYEAGSFTGAHRKGRRGKFEAAHDSTIFLDEIGDMPMEVQVKLLRVLQDGNFTRVGGDTERFSDFRLISATNRDLSKMIEEDKFRLDLYYRISTVTIDLPPLSNRLEDIPELVQHFIGNSDKRNICRIRNVHPSVYRYLQGQPWPGNVRQLLHEVEKATIFCESTELTVANFRPSDIEQESLPVPREISTDSSMKDLLQNYELTLIEQSMALHGGNKKRVAEELGISRSYLYKRLGEIAETDSQDDA